MSRFHQHLREDLRDSEFAEAFYDMSVDIALLQVLEQARKALNVSENLTQTQLWIPSQIYSVR